MKRLSEISLKQWFYATLVLTVVAKFVLAAIVPITSEDAYFTLWAEYLDFGYFDHPPMVAWLIRLTLLLGKHEAIVRLPAVFHSALIGLGIYWVLKDYDTNKARLIAIFFLISPAFLFNFIITHNTPYEFFSFFSAFCLFKAVRSRRMSLYAMAGALLGLGFLSKYLVGFVGLSYLAYFLASKKERSKTLGFILLFLCILPFVAVHLYWNYTHCWYTVNFHFFNRHPNADPSLTTVLLYILALVYIISPPAVFYLVKCRNNLTRKEQVGDFALFFFAFLIPIAVFLLFSINVRIGLHWLLGYFPFGFILLVYYLTEKALVKTIKFTLCFTLLHVLAVSLLLWMPLRFLEKTGFHHLLVYWRHKDQILRKLDPYEGKFHFTTYDYTTSAMNAFITDRYYPVFAYGGYHSRQDDLITDFRGLDGEDILIMSEKNQRAGNYTDFFQKVEIKELKLYNASFFLILGYGFNFDAFKERHLIGIAEKYYMIPKFLPMKSCRFLDNYFKGDERFGDVPPDLEWKGDKIFPALELPSCSRENRRLDESTPAMRYYRQVEEFKTTERPILGSGPNRVLPPGRYRAVFSVGYRNIAGERGTIFMFDAVDNRNIKKGARYVKAAEMAENEIQEFELSFNLQKPTRIRLRVAIFGKGEFFYDKLELTKSTWDYHRPDSIRRSP
ncbi:MAG: glycosyltransferase family 39 protein [Proteobacteria bacterium]|nr:glycosyltransferase family 39 protein [Pseudomonadota bacterium]